MVIYISVSSRKILLFQELLLKWAADHLIDYPWRKNRNPYRILISEILLTRTKAPQVAPVYEKFIKTYPTLEKFLNMDLNIVETLIKSLGLSFRSQNLKEISIKIKENHQNKIPSEFKELKELKGIGDYSANAILCFGFNEKRPLLDSNYIRIYKRVFNITSKTKTAKTDKFLWTFSEDLLPDKNYVDFNYAILDLGGNICTPKKTKCNNCPIKNICNFYKSNL